MTKFADEYFSEHPYKPADITKVWKLRGDSITVEYDVTRSLWAVTFGDDGHQWTWYCGRLVDASHMVSAVVEHDLLIQFMPGVVETVVSDLIPDDMLEAALADIPEGDRVKVSRHRG